MSDLLARLQEAVHERYRIERELGRGGMATVFLAEDLKHSRRVAIKVLDAEVGAVIGPQRFLREINTVAGLTHPHILPLYDSGSSGELLYFVMPYVEGESLRLRLAREGPLPVSDALRYAREVADALEHAHRSGIVHRDIKPENVLLESGHAVVADFGLAQALGTVEPSRLTTSGVILGTPAYMSPEQASAGRSLDGRSDQYNLACTLYELLAGQPPFVAPTTQMLIHQHLHVSPRPVTELRPSVPAQVSDAIARALAKTPADRYASVAEFAAALGGAKELELDIADAGGHRDLEAAPTLEVTAGGRVGAGAGPASTRAGARARVLALTLSLLAVGALGYYVWRTWIAPPTPAPARKDWILVADFAGPPGDSTLAPAARVLLSAALDQSKFLATVTSDQVQQALSAAGRPAGARLAPELARELAYRSAVRAVLEGSIGRIGNGYTIVLRVVDADSGRTIVTADGTAKDADALIPALGELAKRLRRGLGENRNAIAATRSMALVATPSFDAYRLYVRAQSMGGGEDVQAISLLRGALALDPDFAMAWYAIARHYDGSFLFDSTSMACDEALRRTWRLSTEQRFRAEILRQEALGDKQGALDTYDRILMDDPNNRWALSESAGLLIAYFGRFEEGLERMQRIEKLLPFGPGDMTYLWECIPLEYLGRPVEARERALHIHGFMRATAVGWTYLDEGNFATAESAAVTALDDPRIKVEAPGMSRGLLGAARMGRGAVRSADSCEAAAERQAAAISSESAEGSRRQRLLYSIVGGVQAPRLSFEPTRDTTAAALLTRGLCAALTGDTALAHRCVERTRKRPDHERSYLATLPELIEAMNEGHGGHWDRASSLLQPIAVRRIVPGSNLDAGRISWIRWYLADAYEHLGRPDSAAAHLERIVTDPVADEVRPYAELRLVPLDVKLGRGADARRHWADVQRMFTTPDPELRQRMERARAAVATTL